MTTDLPGTRGSAAGLPLLLDLSGRAVLVVGGGTVAAAKAQALLSAGANVHMVALRFHPEVLALAGVTRRVGAYEARDLDGMWLVVSAVDDPAVSASVAADAEAARIFCNAADRPEHCSATMMALHRQGPVTVAVATGGRSPAAAGWVRDRLAAQLEASLEQVVHLAGEARARIRGRRSTEELAWPELLGGLLDDVEAGDEAAADRRVAAFVASAVASPAAGAAHQADRGQELDPGAAATTGVATATVLEDGSGLRSGATTPGRVWLVGAGPGAAELLTLGAAQALARADVVVHDALIGDAVFALVPPEVCSIDVGKRAGAPVDQAKINDLLVSLARQGHRVVRLKGGDPYLFGRGGEEALALQAAGVDFEVVPGVSSALAGPALAGVPVTHRGLAAAVTIITGHRALTEAPIDWQAAARLGGTLVVLMGVTERAAIAAALQGGGMSPETPVVVVERASRPDGRSLRTTLAQLGEASVQAPALLVIGAVAGLDLQPVSLGDHTAR